jgi:hypothetical protein
VKDVEVIISLINLLVAKFLDVLFAVARFAL